VHALFVVVSSPDQQSFYLHSLMWMVQISEQEDFERRWLDAKDSSELRNIILSLWKS